LALPDADPGDDAGSGWRDGPPIMRRGSALIDRGAALVRLPATADRSRRKFSDRTTNLLPAPLLGNRGPYSRQHRPAATTHASCSSPQRRPPWLLTPRLSPPPQHTVRWPRCTHLPARAPSVARTASPDAPIVPSGYSGVNFGPRSGQRKRSSAYGRMTSAATDPSRSHSGATPRTIATGTPVLLPMTSSAAAAISSATHTSVTVRVRP
jgi:hypothetical protein